MSNLALVDRPIDKVKQMRARKAANACRGRLRRKLGQRVFRVTAFEDRLINHLVRKGRLPGDAKPSTEQIEAALTEWLDDEIPA